LVNTSLRGRGCEQDGGFGGTMPWGSNLDLENSSILREKERIGQD